MKQNMHCCAIIDTEFSSFPYQVIFWEAPLGGNYRSYFYENRGYRPVIWKKNVETLKEYLFHEYSLYELEREMKAVDQNPGLRGYYCDPYFKEELRMILEMVKLHSSVERSLLKISYGVKL